VERALPDIGQKGEAYGNNGVRYEAGGLSQEAIARRWAERRGLWEQVDQDHQRICLTGKEGKER
jgi:hypothetical protein